MTGASDSDRLIELEETIAHQSRTIEEMSGEIARQWEEIRGLQRRLDKLADRLAALEDAASPAPDNRPPPHW